MVRVIGGGGGGGGGGVNETGENGQRGQNFPLTELMNGITQDARQKSERKQTIVAGLPLSCDE